jgi:3-dehydroquinate synthase
MTTDTVTTADTSLVIGDGAVAGLGERMRAAGLPGRAFVITDARVAERCAGPVIRSLEAAGYRPELLAVEGGESAKSLGRAGELFAWLAGHRAERRDCVVALGGGVIGDLAGFVAATYLRGVPLVQVPTTVLAQVDSSIGGKTAVNLPQGKNLVGAFYLPRLTLIDVALLDGLPLRELRSGWAEVIKTGAIFDAPLFEALEATPVAAMSRPRLLETIDRCVRWKVRIVEEDPKERGRRILLNFGHTIGHAIEAAAAYGGYLHGEAVSIGMVGASEISQRLGLIDACLVERVRRVLRANELPLRYAPRLAGPEAIMRAAASDKKVQGARLRWVLLTGLGQTTVRDDVPLDLVREVVDSLGGAE